MLINNKSSTLLQIFIIQNDKVGFSWRSKKFLEDDHGRNCNILKKVWSITLKRIKRKK